MNRRNTFVAVPAAAMLLVAMSAAPAMAQDELELGNRATLVARGAAVDVPLTYTCTAPSEWAENTLAVRLTQVVRGGQVATGAEVASPVCDGTSQSTTVRVEVTGTPAFKSGTALATATITMMDMMSPVVTLTDSQEVRIIR